MEDVPFLWGRLPGPWGEFPSKNQSGGGGPPSWEGDGDMCPTSERKTPGPSREGCRR